MDANISDFVYSSSKPIVWVGNSLEVLRAFPSDARQRAGRQLWRVQTGRLPDDWKPLPSCGPGVSEIRIHTERAFRVCYVARFQDAVYVLHAFEKKTRQITKRDAALIKSRLSAVLEARKRSE